MRTCTSSLIAAQTNESSWDVPPKFSVQQVQTDGALLADYRELRIQLWPDCREDCDREIATIFAKPELWAVFVASLENRTAAGFLEVSLRDYAEGANGSPVAYIEAWYIPEHRRQGLGRALVKAAENWAVSRGCNEIASDTQIDNEVSIAAHERLGYQEVERQVCFLKQLKPLT